MHFETKVCRGCGRPFKSFGHRFCARCRYQRQPGPRAIKRTCPVCGGPKARQSDYCAQCWEAEKIAAKIRLQEKAENRGTMRLIQNQRPCAPPPYSRPEPPPPKPLKPIRPREEYVRVAGYRYDD